jgi:hypothetical protein
MAFDVLNVGTTVNDGTGESLRSGGQKINANFAKAVEGPASATADGIPVFDGTSGKLLKSGTGAVIDSSGNVGIGTASPARPLHVTDVMRLQPRATAPGSPAKGDIYFDSSDDKLKCYDGTAWQNLF